MWGFVLRHGDCRPFVKVAGTTGHSRRHYLQLRIPRVVNASRVCLESRPDKTFSYAESEFLDMLLRSTSVAKLANIRTQETDTFFRERPRGTHQKVPKHRVGGGYPPRLIEKFWPRFSGCTFQLSGHLNIVYSSHLALLRHICAWKQQTERIWNFMPNKYMSIEP